MSSMRLEVFVCFVYLAFYLVSGMKYVLNQYLFNGIEVICSLPET